MGCLKYIYTYISSYIYTVEMQEAEGQRGNKGGACWEEDKAFLSYGTWDQVKFNQMLKRPRGPLVSKVTEDVSTPLLWLQ